MGYFAVVDGMGGHRHGKLAAELTLSTIQYYLQSSQGRPDVTWPFGYNMVLSLNSNRLATAIRLANRQVWRRAEQQPEYAGMGSTVAAVLVAGGEAAVANIGDSRVYLFRDGELKQLTADDTWLNAVIASGTLQPESLARHPMRNFLTQSVGSQTDVDVHTTDLPFESGDVLILSTDGLHAVIGDDAIRAMLTAGGTSEYLAKSFIQSARAAGGPDNIACVVVKAEA
jgi:protein phosphatase